MIIKIISIVCFLLSLALFFSVYVLRTFHQDSSYDPGYVTSYSELQPIILAGVIFLIVSLFLFFKKHN